MKYPEYQIGARWRVERNSNSCTFVIIGPGSKPGHKLCRVEFDTEQIGFKNFEGEFSHTHLKIHATYQPSTKSER